MRGIRMVVGLILVLGIAVGDARWSAAPAGAAPAASTSGPPAMAVDRAAGRLYTAAAEQTGVAVIDLATGIQVAA